MNADLEQYIRDHSAPEGDYLYRLYRATQIHTIHGRMQSGHLQGRLLKMLVMMQRPQRILEVGTFSGYSALCMAEGLAEIDRQGSINSAVPQKTISSELPALPSLPKLITFEINDEMEDFTRPWIEQSPWAQYVDFRIGDAAVEAPLLGERFDMAFIDGDKRHYVETYEALLPLMNAGAIILADNTLWDGHVVDPAYDHDQQTQGIRRFNDHMAQDQRVEQFILPIRDGLTMIRVR